MNINININMNIHMDKGLYWDARHAHRTACTAQTPTHAYNAHMDTHHTSTHPYPYPTPPSPVLCVRVPDASIPAIHAISIPVYACSATLDIVSMSTMSVLFRHGMCMCMGSVHLTCTAYTPIGLQCSTLQNMLLQQYLHVMYNIILSTY